MIDFDFLRKFNLSYDYVKFDFLTSRLFVGINIPSNFDDRVFYISEKRRFIEELKSRGYTYKYNSRNADYDIVIFEKEDD